MWFELREQGFDAARELHYIKRRAMKEKVAADDELIQKTLSLEFGNWKLIYKSRGYESFIGVWMTKNLIPLVCQEFSRQLNLGAEPFYEVLAEKFIEV